jgi:hypothetical protein
MLRVTQVPTNKCPRQVVANCVGLSFKSSRVGRLVAIAYVNSEKAARHCRAELGKSSDIR